MSLGTHHGNTPDVGVDFFQGIGQGVGVAADVGTTMIRLEFPSPGNGHLNQGSGQRRKDGHQDARQRIDRATILASVRKTGRLVAVDEANRTCSIASEISALVAEEAFGALKAPIRRVARADAPVANSPPLEAYVTPTADKIAAAVKAMGGIDAIVSDWNMPVMDGGQFVRALRAAGHLMPVIMVTVEADQNRVRELIQTGIQGYIVKPFKAETVHRALEKLLQRL